MKILKTNSHLFLVIIIGSMISCGPAKEPSGEEPKVDPVAALYSNTQVISNIEYANIDSTHLLLDTYVQANRLGGPPWISYTDNRKPTLLFLHGGGWISGDKISRSLFLMPFVDKGWNIVTANYRHLDQTGLTGCISDARLALNWIYDNAEKYKFDTTRIIVSGESAGGHLSLMTGLVTDNNIFQEAGHPINRPLKVAGIINWFGVADLVKASKDWDDEYFSTVTGGIDNADSLFLLASPVTYIDERSTPVISIHGDQDTSAPYNQSVLLHDMLDKKGIKNHFFTIPGKKHGDFDPMEMTQAFDHIWAFLREIGVE